MLGEYHLCGSKPAKNDILDVQRQLFHASDSILNARAHSVDDMKICFQFLLEHPDWVQNAVLSIDHRFVHAFHRSFKINNLAFAHAARRRLAYTEDFDGAIGSTLADNDANFGGANLETNHQIIARHGCYPFSFAEWEFFRDESSSPRAPWASMAQSLPANPAGLPS